MTDPEAQRAFRLDHHRGGRHLCLLSVRGRTIVTQMLRGLRHAHLFLRAARPPEPPRILATGFGFLLSPIFYVGLEEFVYRPPF
jgi:hypothetical protein